jgi:hypothetical protein
VSASGVLLSDAGAPLFYPNGNPCVAAGGLCFVSPGTGPFSYVNGFKYDTTGRLVTIDVSVAVAPFSSQNGFTFDVNGALITTPDGSAPPLLSWAWNTLASGVVDGNRVLLFLLSTSGAVVAAPSGWTLHASTVDANGYGLGVYSSIYAPANATADSTNFPYVNGYFLTLRFDTGKSVLQVGAFGESAPAALSVVAPALASTTGASSKLLAWLSSRDPQLVSLTSDSGMTSELATQDPVFFDASAFSNNGVQSGSRTFSRVGSGSLVYNFIGILMEIG